MDYNLLLRSTPSAVARHLRDLIRLHGEGHVSDGILAAIQNELVPPTVMSTWLSVTKTPIPNISALVQTLSPTAQIFAIVRLAIFPRTHCWKEDWDGLGGTQGILGLLAKFSVDSVNKFARGVSRSYRSTRSNQKEDAIDELVKCLFPSIFPERKFANPDPRPLRSCYMVRIQCVSRPWFCSDHATLASNSIEQIY